MALSTNTTSTPTQGTVANNTEQQSGKNQSVQLIAPFSRSGKKHTEKGDTYDIAWGKRKNTSLPSFGYMRGGALKIVAHDGADTVETVAVALAEDAPWSAIESFVLQDTNSNNLITADGVIMKYIRKYGGYAYQKPEAGSVYKAVDVGASKTGDFAFLLEWFTEFGRDGLGNLPNDEANALYKYQLKVADSADFYSVAPDTLPTISVTEYVECRGTPDGVDMFGNQQATEPPNNGTTQYWSYEEFDVTSGDNKCQLKEVGNMIRNHFLEFRSSTDGSRATAVSDGIMPTTISMDWDKGNIFQDQDVDYLLDKVGRAFGLNIPTEDPGLIVLPYTADVEGLAIAEFGDDWMPTVAQSKVTFRFKSTHAGKLRVVTNYFVPGSGNIYAPPAMQIAG